MKKQTIKLNEAQLNKLIKESVKKVLREGTTDQTLEDAWINAKEQIGAEAFLDALYAALDEDTIRENLEYIDRMYDLGLFAEDVEDEY